MSVNSAHGRMKRRLNLWKHGYANLQRAYFTKTNMSITTGEYGKEKIHGDSERRHSRKWPIHKTETYIKTKQPIQWSTQTVCSEHLMNFQKNRLNISKRQNFWRILKSKLRSVAMIPDVVDDICSEQLTIKSPKRTVIWRRASISQILWRTDRSLSVAAVLTPHISLDREIRRNA